VGDDRLSIVLRTVGGVDGEDSGSVVDRVCTAATSLLSATGAGISLMVNGELRGTAGVAEGGVAAVQELQLALGQGPCVEAWEVRAVVMEPDLADPAVLRWPAFAQAAVRAGLRAVFAFPLTLGAIRVGVLVLYRDRPGPLSANELAYGLVVADVATHLVLGLQSGAPAGSLHALLAGQPGHWAEIHQATGVISVQLGVPLKDAFVRLRAHAFATDIPLRDVAREVVGGRLRLEQSA
jgi:GAF domain/ANTAR domain